MNIGVISIALMTAATVINLTLILLLISGQKYSQMLEPLNPKEFSMKDAYGLGLRLLELKKETYRSKWFFRQEEYLNILYEKKYVSYYIRIYCAKRLTFTAIVFALMLTLSAMGGENAVLLLVLTLLITWAVYKNYSEELDRKIEKRSDQLVAELPEMATRLALLINAGMILREAWDAVAVSGDALLYQEMRLVSASMKNGTSESGAIFLLGKRSESNEVRKFCSQVIQAIDKGGTHLAYELAQLSLEMVELKRQYVTRRADAASTKLLLPLFVMFAGVLLLVMAPILINML